MVEARIVVMVMDSIVTRVGRHEILVETTSFIFSTVRLAFDRRVSSFFSSSPS